MSADPNASDAAGPRDRSGKRRRRDPRERFTMNSAEGVEIDGRPWREWLRLHGGDATPGQLDTDEGDDAADVPFVVDADADPNPPE
jgi:hypothetical protein